MIKGILALFNTGVIFNPMVLLGILLGFTAMIFLEGEQLKALYTNYHLYLLMFFISALYVYFFRRVYYRGGVETDWNQTIASMIGHFLRFVLSFICGMLFIYSISFGGDETEQEYMPEFDQLENEIRKQQNELQKNYQAIMDTYDLSSPAPAVGTQDTPLR